MKIPFKRKKIIILSVPAVILASALIFVFWYMTYYPDDREFLDSEADHYSKEINNNNRSSGIIHCADSDNSFISTTSTDQPSNPLIKKLYETNHLKDDPYSSSPFIARFSTGSPGKWLDEKKSLIVPTNKPLRIILNRSLRGGILDFSCIYLNEKINGSTLTELTVKAQTGHGEKTIFRKKISSITKKELVKGTGAVHKSFRWIKRKRGWRSFRITLPTDHGDITGVSFSFSQNEENTGIGIIGTPVIETDVKKKKKYNLMYIVFDAMAQPYMGIYNKKSKLTPHMDSMEDSFSIFENMYSTATKTQIFLSSFLTSRFPMDSRHGINFNVFPEEDDNLFYRNKSITTLPRVLSAQGYRTVQIGASGFSHPFLSTGLDFGFDESYEFQELPDENTALSLEILRRTKKMSTSPFFMYVHLNSTHTPRLTPLSYYLHGSWLHPEFLWRPNVTGATLYSDQIFKSIMDFLKKSGLIDKTIVIISADHGTACNIKHYGQNFNFNDFTKIPMLIYLPPSLRKEKKLKTGRLRTYVSALDMAPTIIDLLDCLRDNRMAGKSLVPLLKGKNAGTAYNHEFIWSFDDFTISCVYKGRWKYILIQRGGGKKFRKRKWFRWGPGMQDASEQLYDLANDPDEMQNIALSRPDILSVFRNRIKKERFYPEINLLTIMPSETKSKTHINISTGSKIIRARFLEKTDCKLTRGSNYSLEAICSPGSEPVHLLFETENPRTETKIKITENGLPLSSKKIIAGPYNLPLYGNPIVFHDNDDFLAALAHARPDPSALKKSGAHVHICRIDIRRWMKSENLVSDKNLDENMKKMLKSWGYIQ